MAMVMENQQPLARMPLVPAPPPPPPVLPQAYKHRCRVCKKGFMCGRALGGHMRAHGVAADGLSADEALDDDAAGPCGGGDSPEAGSASAAAATAKRMYALRTNPGRLKNCRVCENCGKEFTSWKSLLDHGKCNYDEEGDLDGDATDDGEEGEDLALAAGWSKGKRTRRAKVMVVGDGSITTEEQLPAPSSEEEDLANFLVMLSSSASSAARPHVVVEVDQEPCARKNEQRNQLLVPQPIAMVAPAVPHLKLLAPPQVLPHHVSTVPRGMFECKACKKVFTSHQALGGHRASHKKVKGCFAAKLESNRTDPPQPVVASANDKVVGDAIPATVGTEQNTTGVDGSVEGNSVNAETGVVVMATAPPEMAGDEVPATSGAAPFKKKGKVHECSICHRVFMSGQALGGHKRCHWLTTGAGDPTGAVAKLQPFVTQDHVMHAMCQQLTLGRPMFDASDPFLDLNVPTNPAEEPAATRQAAKLNDSVLSLNAPASLYMHSWAGHSNASNMNNTATSGHDDAAEAAATEDEADSTSAKRAKISDLKDMNMAGETSAWLQVGIGLPSEINEEKATQA
ncbi:hypothetical protein GQ55_1G327200 [Panicum hallii var. hallii]|uniref:C2H2-type domain-containing protein n=1 Tax=Panicum hallii var. hallii TaxID=1504633 RepID=A0A2T7FA01_9POAL|nr:hypothetical protein GQ55_1G327200 [Panicum hallii var. hallii]